MIAHGSILHRDDSEINHQISSLIFYRKDLCCRQHSVFRLYKVGGVPYRALSSRYTELGMLEDKYRTKVDFSGTKIKVIRSQANEGDNFKDDYHVVLLSNGFVNSCNLFYCPFIFTFHSSLAIYF